MAKFSKGDVVVLKSGGPKMTVVDVGDYSMGLGPKNGVSCVWFDKMKKCDDCFDEEALDHAGLVA